ncbi:MAG: hypothetical protein GTO18_21980 [Anaerolineales bacterium]|nr:hypothetical protein [Anaerolineales bacterium]
METWLPIILFALALLFLILWRREVAWRMRYMLQARRRQREAERLLEQSEERLEQLGAAADATSDLLLTVGGDLQVIDVNLAAREVFGELGEETSLITYAGSYELESLVVEVMELEGNGIVERVIRIRDRSYRARVMVIPEGIGVALTNVDELQRLSRARQDMITNLSHEIRTPLTSLRLLADTMKSPAGQDPEVARDLAGKIIVEVDQLHQMAEEMFDLVAIESGKMVMRLTSVPLIELVEGPIERLQNQAARREVTVLVDVDPELVVLADREQAARAVTNVLHNALKYSPEGGEVRIAGAYSREEDRILLSIADSGPGIPPDELERIFERFYRTQWAWGTPGTGLGLAIARHIMQAHGGRIWAENRSLPDRGAILFLEFNRGD